MSDAADMPENELVDGRYRIVRKIADGGMATVYMAVDVRLGRNVALKIMHIQLAQGPHRDQFVERFKREAKAAAAIANPHVVQVYDTGEHNGLDYLVMEYVHGVNLRHDMQTKRTFSVRETLRIVGETLQGLAAAHHAGVVHRDIKPENILINDRGRVQITDFGLAKAASQATLSSTGMLLGTAAYLAPEMIEHNQATPQGDCYSVGIMAWEMLTGQVPFMSDNPVTMVFKHVNENVPSVATVCVGIDPRVARYISWLTDRSVADRPENASQALDRLQSLMTQLTPQALAYRYDPSRPAPQATSILATPANAGVAAAVPQAPVQAANPPSSSTASASNPQVQPNNAPTQAIAPGTQALPQHQQQMPSTAGTADHIPTLKQPKPKKKHLGLIIGIISAVVVLAAAGGGAAWWYFKGPGSYNEMPSAEGLECQENVPCAITGIAWDAYKQSLDVSNIQYEVHEEFSDTVPAGDVISTDPAYVGSHVSKRNEAPITVTVSKGVQQATVPDNIMDSSDPVAELKNAGFTDVEHNADDDEWSMDVPAGQLISIDVDPGETLNHNTPITVVISKGPMPVTMPDVIGKTKEEANSILTALQLKVTYEEQYDDNVEAGKVLYTSEDADTTLHWGDSVTVTLSKGPEMVTVPNVVGKNIDEAKKTLEDLGLEVKVSAPLGDILHTVRIQSPKAGDQVRLRDKDGNPTVVTLTVI